ncbi:hypothetical protein QSI_2378 [Clostridioides difficile P28]|nr:hypothetical protein QSI_2378 [Clostridioides difficile P28]
MFTFLFYHLKEIIVSLDSSVSVGTTYTTAAYPETCSIIKSLA